MARIIILAALILTRILAQAQDEPSNTITQPGNGTAGPLEGDIEAKYRLFGWHNCADAEKQAIKDAFGEKDKITAIDSSFHINWHGALAVDYIRYVPRKRPVATTESH
jgi:hypothetical protein